MYNASSSETPRKGDREEVKEAAFNRSKRVIRSPEYWNRQTESKANTIDKEESSSKQSKMDDNNKMEKLMAMIQEMMSDIKELKAEMRGKEEKWEKEKEQLSNRISELEIKARKEEREKRKNNIIIKGLQTEHQNTQREVEKLIEEKLQIPAKTLDAFKINKPGKGGIILVKMESWDKKQEMMKRAKKLKGTEIYLDHDLTIEDRKIQYEIRSIAKEENKKGNKTKIEYKKLVIEGVLYKWSEKEKGLVSEKDWDQEEIAKNS